ncbi:hypothetical protein FKM82_010896 [Ascaphus truei]
MTDEVAPRRTAPTMSPGHYLADPQARVGIPKHPCEKKGDQSLPSTRGRWWHSRELERPSVRRRSRKQLTGGKNPRASSSWQITSQNGGRRKQETGSRHQAEAFRTTPSWRGQLARKLQTLTASRGATKRRKRPGAQGDIAVAPEPSPGSS